MSSACGQSEWLITNRDELFSDLWAECLRTPPQAGFSSRLKARLERLEPEARTALVSRERDGCAPLLLAAKSGSKDLVTYLVEICDAPVDQRGLYTVAGGGRAHIVTPLWAAAVAGHLQVVVALRDAGADIDAQSDSGSTPLRSACFMSREDVVRYLIEEGADVCRANHSGGTCLINAVQSVSLCRMLLQYGAPVDAADLQGKTALHYAVQEQRMETSLLLLAYGADPRKKSISGDDALRTAACRAPSGVLDMLLERCEYTLIEKYDALLLSGATALDEMDDPYKACRFWREAIELRQDPRFPPWSPPAAPAALLPHYELSSLNDITMLEADPDAMRAQALIIAHRVLGPTHNYTLYRIVYRGAAYVDAFCYTRCIQLWTWSLGLRFQRDTILYSESCRMLCALVRLLLETKAGTYEELMILTRMVAEYLPEGATLIQCRPQCRSQTESFDRTVRAVTHLLHLLLEASATEEQKFETMRLIYRVVKMNLQVIATGDSLLHLSVSRLNTLRTDGLNDQLTTAVFPSLSVCSALLRAGASARLRNTTCCTPLHVAALPHNLTHELIDTLLSADGHLDTPNRFGESGATLCARAPNYKLAPLNYITLQCLAAVASVKVDPNIDNYPPHLHHVLRLHLP